MSKPIKYRIYDMAKEFNQEDQVIIDFLNKRRIKVKNRFSGVESEAYELVKANFARRKPVEPAPKPEQKSQPQPKQKPAQKSEQKSQPQQRQPKPAQKSEQKPQPQQQRQPKPAPKPEQKPQPQQQRPKPAPKPEQKPAQKIEAKPAPKPEQKSQPKFEQKISRKLSGATNVAKSLNAKTNPKLAASDPNASRTSKTLARATIAASRLRISPKLARKKTSRTIAGNAATVNQKIVSATTAATEIIVSATATAKVPPTQKRLPKLRRRPLKLKIKIARRDLPAKKIAPRLSPFTKQKSRARRTSKSARALPSKIWQAR